MTCPHCGCTFASSSVLAEETTAKVVPTPHAASPTSDSGTEASSDLFQAASSSSSGSARAGHRRKRKPSGPTLLLAVTAVVSLLVSAGVAILVISRSHQGGSLALKTIPEASIDELDTLEFVADVRDHERWKQRVTYALTRAPQGATIQSNSGRFRWTPSERQGPNRYPVTIRVSSTGGESLYDEATFYVRVNEVNRPPRLQPIEDATVVAEGELRLTATAVDDDFPRAEVEYSLGPDAPNNARIDHRSGEIRWRPSSSDAGKVIPITVRATEIAPNGLSVSRRFLVRVSGDADTIASKNERRFPGEDAAVTIASKEGSAPVVSSESDAESAVSREVTGSGDLDPLVQLYESKKLFVAKDYPVLRKYFADRFEKEHDAQIREAYGDNYGEMTNWLNSHLDVKEEFYTAIDPEHDNVAAALTLFKELKQKFPDKILPYANLAIAVAVTWDDPRKGVYSYDRHTRWTKTKMPEGALGAIDNFKYFLDTEDVMQGRCRFLPWEFLTLVIDHKTPVNERQWALQTYLPRRAMYGKCYHDVPYDTLMLNSDFEQARLNGQQYTLPNIRLLGGVCAIQADYAARVGKSLGVPAAYVGGGSSSGERHAWVMWVELLGVSETSISFSLESAGRYRYDNYYVGTLIDPQTGLTITDRELELRLHRVGVNPIATRHAQLIMKAYSLLQKRVNMDVVQRFLFLQHTIEISPGNEEAWTALARMSHEEIVQTRYKKQMRHLLDQLFVTFSSFPDFTWKVFDDLIAFEKDPRTRIQLYQRLARLYEEAGRADLAFAAHLKMANYLVDNEQVVDAIEDLASVIKRFPNEGNYVPHTLDRLEELCKQVDGASDYLVPFYLEFLPMIPEMRGDRPSPYCIKMFERGIDLFGRNGLREWQAKFGIQLAKIKAGMGRPD